MILDLLNKFELEVVTAQGETTFNGIFRDFTKAEQKAFKEKNKDLEDSQKEINKKLSKIKELEEMIDIEKNIGNWKTVKQMTEAKNQLKSELENFSDIAERAENLMKERLEICISCDKKDELIALGETVGFQKLLETLSQAVQEAKGKK